MKIGNIVSKTKISVSEDFNVVESLDDINPELPTLLIGMDYVSKNYPDYDITDRKLGPKLYWTFKKTENRSLQEDDINKFMYQAYLDLISDVNYVYVDAILFGKQKLRKIIKKILSLTKSVVYKDNNMIYIYGDKLIFGIDLKQLCFIDANINRIMSKIKHKCNVFLESNEILIEYKKNVERLENKVRYIPYLYSINHG
jgi:hypothetical protein